MKPCPLCNTQPEIIVRAGRVGPSPLLRVKGNKMYPVVSEATANEMRKVLERLWQNN